MILKLICINLFWSKSMETSVKSLANTLQELFQSRLLVDWLIVFKVGLLSTQLSTRNYAVLRKRLSLTLDDVDEQVINPLCNSHHLTRSHFL